METDENSPMKRLGQTIIFVFAICGCSDSNPGPKSITNQTPDGAVTADQTQVENYPQQIKKLTAATGATRSITRGAAHLCIVDPSPGLLSSRQGFLADVLASHPPIRQRIIRLQGMGYQRAKREAAVG